MNEENQPLVANEQVEFEKLPIILKKLWNIPQNSIKKERSQTFNRLNSLNSITLGI